MNTKILSCMTFLYDARGFGDLVLSNGVSVADRLVCRTVSIDRAWRLINAMPIGNYAIKSATVSTTENGMWIGEPAHGWKAMLLLLDDKGALQPTRLRIHPDGGKRPGDGTLGCIGIQGSNAPAFRHGLDRAVLEQGTVLLTVGRITRGVA